MKTTAVSLAMLAAGGALGTISRYYICLLAARLYGNSFAWGTLGVNIIGCLAIGFAFALAQKHILIAQQIRLFFMVGFLGALTTFSTYALESVNFALNGVFNLAIINFAANNMGGIIFAILGLWLGSRL